MTDQPTPDPATIEQAAREMVLAESEPWIREWAAEHDALPDSILMRLPAVEQLLQAALRSRSDLWVEALEEAAKLCDQYLSTTPPMEFADARIHFLAKAIRALKATPITADEEGLG